MLDRTTIDQVYHRSGSKPYDPVALLKVVLYQYLKGNQSPATWHEEAQRNEAMQWLGRGYAPARRTWYDFRDRVGKFIENLNDQIIAQGLDRGLDATVGVQDGTAVAACASRHRMVSHCTLNKRIAQLGSISFTESKKKAKPNQQISRDEFGWDEAEQCYRCPQGHRLDYRDRARKQRHGGRQLWESRYRCDPAHCGACPLADQCLRPGSTCRTIKRLEGQELLDAQREKMADAEVQSRYRLRGQTVELAYADSKGNRRLQRFHGRGLARVRAETGLMVVAQNLLHLDRLERNHLTTVKTQT